MSKKTFYLLVMVVISVFSFGQHHIALAEEAPAPIIYPFTHSYGDPLIIASNTYLPEVDDEVLILFTLPVTDELLSGLLDGMRQGLDPFILFQTRGSVDIIGSGSGSYSAQVFVAIDRTEGGRIVLFNETEEMQAMESGFHNGSSTGAEYVKLDIQELNLIDLLETGDTLVIGGKAKGWTSSSPESGNQVMVSWKIINDSVNPYTSPVLSIMGEYFKDKHED